MRFIASTRFRYFRNLVQVGILLPCLLFVVGYGNDSSSSTSTSSNNDVERGRSGPTIDISFPLPNSNLAGETDRVTIRGRSLSVGRAHVDQVLIHYPTPGINHQDSPPGMAETTIAEFDPADPSRWSARIPLLRHSNEIVIEASDNRGRSRTVKLNVRNQPMFSDPKDVVWDNANQRALVVDKVMHALLAVDLNNGEISLISGLSTGTGLAFESPEAVALDSANNRALVMDWNLKALLSVDLGSGNRTIISKNGVKGAGPAFVGSGDLSLDSANQRVLVADDGLSAFFTVDLDSGDRTVISDENTGAGPAFFTPEAVDLDSANNRALVTDSGLGALLEVDLNSGDRTVISDENTGSGPAFDFPVAVALDNTNGRALIMNYVDLGDDYRIALVAVDLDSGDRTVISDENTGAGPLFFSVDPSIALDKGKNRALVVDGESGLNALLTVDLSNGNRTKISDSSLGSGPPFNFPSDVAIDNANRRALVVNRGIQDEFSGALLAVNLNGGNRSVISSNSTGKGHSFDLPEAMALDTANNRALVVDNGANNPNALLIAVNLRSGNRKVISNESTGIGPVYSSLALDRAHRRVLATDYNIVALAALNLRNGRRTEISNNTASAGPEFNFPYGVTLDRSNNRALVIDSGSNALLGVDLNSGTRTLISNNATATGPNFDFPEDVAFDRDNNLSLVVNVNALLAVDLDSGQRTVISNNSTGVGPELDSPSDIAFDSDNRRALVLDNGLKVVDIISGDRAIVSQ